MADSVMLHSCCREAGTCNYWHDQNERYSARPYTNFCYMRGSVCNAAGAARDHGFMFTPCSRCVVM
jgi:hypothetical protein